MQPLLHRLHARADLKTVAAGLERELERADRDQHVERADVAHMSDPDELALHLILAALNRNAKNVAHMADHLRSVHARRCQESADARGWTVRRDQPKTERG